MSISLLNPFLTNIVVSEYDSAEQARQAFMATGSMFRIYQGQLAVDGGATDCAPLFKDEQRQQLHVRPTRAGLDMSMVATATTAEAREAVQKGQDDIVQFLMGTGGDDALELKDERPTWKVQKC